VYDIFSESLALISEQLEVLCAPQQGVVCTFFYVLFSFFAAQVTLGLQHYHACRKKRDSKTSKWPRRILGNDSTVPCSVPGFMNGCRVRPIYFLDCIVMFHLFQCVSFVLRSHVHPITDVAFIQVSFVLRAWQLVSVEISWSVFTIY
jgi:hypothetical protein